MYMKVTAIIDDSLIKEAMEYANASTITEALKVALNEYVTLKKLKDLGNLIKVNPLNFNATAEDIRNTNREL